MSSSGEFQPSVDSNRVLSLFGDVDVTLSAEKRASHMVVRGIGFDLPLLVEQPIILETEKGKITIEDLALHPMSLGNRWGMAKDRPEYRISDHQERFIVTFEAGDKQESYIIPKIFEEGEPVARVTLDRTKTPRPFTITMAEVTNAGVVEVVPKKPLGDARIVHGTQILGHVQDAAKLQIWAHGQGSLIRKWNFALPATPRTETTINGLTNMGVPADIVTSNWSYAGGKDFRTGSDHRADFNQAESFTSVAGFLAANAQLCLDVAKGKYAVASTNFRAEAQILREINKSILLAGVTFTFLTGKPGERAIHHADLPRFAHMLQRVQISLDSAPDRIASLGEDREHVDDWWKISSQKIRDVNVLLYRSFDFDMSIPKRLNGITQVIEIPHPIPEVRVSYEQARENIGTIIGRQLRPEERVIILAGESDDGSFRNRAQEVFAYAQTHPEVHVIMPLRTNDARIEGLQLPVNAHAIGFRNDWMDIIPGGDVTTLRGSWGEMLDVVASGVIPLITSPGTVPTDKDLDKTQFLTEVSGERACNLSLFIQALQRRGISAETINGLLVDFDNPQDPYTLQQAIAFALQPEIAQEIRAALSSIQKNGIEWVGRLHEQLLDQKRSFESREVDRLHRLIWTPERTRRRFPWSV